MGDNLVKEAIKSRLVDFASPFFVAPRMSDRVLLDTNVLLNAAFFLDGQSHKAVNYLVNAGFQLLVDDYIMQEALKVLRNLSGRLDVHFDADEELKNFCASKKVVHLPPAEASQVTGVNRADTYVVAAATIYGCGILTNDADLIVQSRRSQILAFMPSEVLMANPSTAKERLNDIFHLDAPHRDEGYMFTRVEPGGWGGKKAVGVFAVGALENWGALKYDSYAGAWIFELTGVGSVSVKADPKEGDIWTVCGTYRLRPLLKTGVISLYVADRRSFHVSKSVQTLSVFADRPWGQNILIGRDVGDVNFFYGSIGPCSMGSKFLSKERWKSIKLTNGAPNAQEDGGLGQALIDYHHDDGGSKIKVNRILGVDQYLRTLQK